MADNNTVWLKHHITVLTVTRISVDRQIILLHKNTLTSNTIAVYSEELKMAITKTGNENRITDIVNECSVIEKTPGEGFEPT